jgi:hypothetical protein
MACGILGRYHPQKDQKTGWVSFSAGRRGDGTKLDPNTIRSLIKAACEYLQARLPLICVRGFGGGPAHGLLGILPKQISFFHDGLLLRSHLSGVFTYEAFADWARLSVQNMLTRPILNTE